MFSESDGYERFMGRWSRRLAPLFVTFAGVTGGDRVLDVGSGTGALSAAAAAIESVQVTGIEPAAAYVRYAQERLDGHFEVGDAMALPFADDSFDRTLAMLVLNFVPDPAAAADDPGHPSRRCRRRDRMGLRRGNADAADVLGRGRRARSGRGAAR